MDLKILQATPPWDWPQGTGKRLKKVLVDRRASASDRLIAAELAGDLVVMDDELAKTLTAVVRNAEEAAELRAKAAIAFGAVFELAYTYEFEDPEDVPITEETFNDIQATLRELYFDVTVPKEVRRRILEASVRAPETWHEDAIKVAYDSGDRDWGLTAVFAMRWVRGFDQQILEALKSTDPDIHYEAVEAAGNWGLAAAWSHVVALVRNARTEKELLIAAIGGVGNIRPAEAREVLEDLVDSEDEDIAEAAEEAIGMAEIGGEGEEDEMEEDKGEWIN